jgi:hypothetical protein
LTSITIVAHLDWDEDAHEHCWWAESDDVPGFTAVYPSLGELQREAENAVSTMLCQAGEPVEIRWTTTDDVPSWAAVHISLSENRIVSQFDSGNMMMVRVVRQGLPVLLSPYRA